MAFWNFLSNVNIESFIPEIACLTVDAVCLGVFYRLYHKSSQGIHAIEAAPEYEIDQKLLPRLQKADKNIVPYAAIRGIVHGINGPIPSQQVAGAAGVIQNVSITEHKVQWSPISRLWSDSRYEIQKYVNEVPFHLTSSTFFNKVKVTIEEPLSARDLTLTTVYDKFTPKSDTFGGYLISWVRGERSKGFQVTEKLLLEGTTLTGIGELVLDNKEIKLRPPSKYLEYHLTSLTKDSLVKLLEKDVQFYKVLTYTFGILGVYILFYVGRSIYSDYKSKMQSEADSKKLEELKKRRLRNARDPGGANDTNASPMCVVCLNNPVEVMVMECGHVCLCTDCAEQVTSCPICRRSIAQTVAAFLP